MLWLKSGTKRELVFEPDKVNVITGGSNTGKTAILEIIDYCLLASKSKIAESIINENIYWYGVVFCINDKTYTICRTSLYLGKATNNFYFSSTGEVPETPKINIDLNSLKALLENEFSIDKNVVVPNGGSHVKAGSKFSFRDFLLFTTISEDIITNSTVFFDKQTEARKREILERIFDLAIGVDNIENVIARERKKELEDNLKYLERKKDRLNAKKNGFEKELANVLKQAKEYSLINADAEPDLAIKSLEKAICEYSAELSSETNTEFDKLQKEINSASLTIKNFKKLKSEFQQYKKTIGKQSDFLKPITYISEKRDNLVKTSIFDKLIKTLEKDFYSIKQDTKKQTPIDRNLDDLIKQEEEKIDQLKEKMSSYPAEFKQLDSERNMYFFLGETSAKLDLYKPAAEIPTSEIDDEISNIESILESIHIEDVHAKREAIVALLEEFIDKYITLANEVLENYKNYKPKFDYKLKSLLLRKPLSDRLENVGSSSNHMFMHLFLFLGIHELVKFKDIPFIPSFLIIDQPSRPYWGESKSDKDALETGDENKMKKVFELFNEFLKSIFEKKGSNFQIIVFEHVPPSYWKGKEHICLIEEFIGGNALIPFNDLNKGN